MKNRYKLIAQATPFMMEYLLILVFLYAALIKVADFNGWYSRYNTLDFVRSYRLGWFAYVLPIMEVGVATAFFFRRCKIAAAYAASVLMLVFTCYVYYKIYISEDSLCSCGGIFGFLTLDKHLYLNVFLLVVSFALTVLGYLETKEITKEKTYDNS